MDSGLGSDDEKRSRTKAQKQLQNEQKQLFSSCFIDATSLGDEGECEHRRNDERRQGALIFRSSIPQYSMLQMPLVGELDASQSSSASNMQEEKVESLQNQIATPHNSIVQLDAEVAKRTPIGFYVDLGNVEVAAEASPPPPMEKKNIFSMTIDFNVPKREMPSRLSNSLYGRKKKENSSKSAIRLTTSQLSEGTSNYNTDSFSDTCSEYQVSLESNVETTVETDIKEDQFVVEKDRTENVTVNETNEDSEISACNADDVKDKGNQKPCTSQYVRLSDLEEQSPRIDLFLAPRMSRSIPEKSWVESPLATFRSASYRSSPQPFQLESNYSNEATSLTDSSSLPPRRSVQRLGTDLLRMFLGEIGPDVTIDVNGRRVRAHKCILSSRCQYFAAVLGGNSSEEVVSIQGYSFAAVHFALCHIYSGAAHIPESISIVELAALADMLGLEGLKEVVAHALKVRHCHNFHKPCTGCITGVVEVLPLSAAYGLDELYQDSLHWIVEHFTEVWPSRTFANLPRDMREKCYQQHVVHMVPDVVLEKMLKCDKLLTTMPTTKWAELVTQLILQLADFCQIYLRQHFSAILICSSFIALDGEPNSCIQLEESLISAADVLKLDQACNSYINCHKHLQKTSWTSLFLNLLRKIYTRIENCIVRQINQTSRSAVWMQLEPALRRRIRDLSTASVKKMQTTTYSRSESSNLPSSSSDSSRNSSPAIKNVNRMQLPSPSLRRSLLIAARTAYTPPSPSTCRRTSTLTKPTQSSAAKTTNRTLPNQKNITSKSTTSSKNVQSLSLRKEQTRRVFSTTSSTKKENQPKKPVATIKNAPKKEEMSNSIPKRAVGTITRTNQRSSTAAPKQTIPSEQKKKVSGNLDKANKQSPPVRRSGTFLKEEPTVLGKM